MPMRPTGIVPINKSIKTLKPGSFFFSVRVERRITIQRGANAIKRAMAEPRCSAMATSRYVGDSENTAQLPPIHAGTRTV